ncbi:MAG: hypothetical protein ACKOKH_05920, partial [Bacteroidota bacterium]
TSVQAMALHLYHGISALWGHEDYQAVCRQGGLLGDPLEDAIFHQEPGILKGIAQLATLPTYGLKIFVTPKGRNSVV